MKMSDQVSGVGGRRRAMTLVELLTTLSIMAVVSTAVVAMLRAGSQASSAMGASMTSQWEVESAIIRMVQQVRMSGSTSVPTGVSGGTTFSLVTQPDSANGNTTYAVTYAMVTAADGTKQLQETDTRYGTSVLVHNVQSCDVRTKAATGTQVLIMTISAGTGVPVMRTVRAMPRNQ